MSRKLERPLRGFYAILDTGYVSDKDWEPKATALVTGGACLLQVRAKGEPPDTVRELVGRVLPICRRAGIPLIVNDHLEVACGFPGTGLHLGQEDGDLREARKALGPDPLLGRSTHSLEQAREAIRQRGILSYFAVGPVFPTGTKPDYPAVGLELVRKVSALDPPLPFFCIGGINRHNLEEVLIAGARSVVAVSDPLLDPDTENAVRTYAHRLSMA